MASAPQARVRGLGVAICIALAFPAVSSAAERPDLVRFGTYTTPRAGRAKDFVYVVHAAGPPKIARIVAGGGRFEKLFFASLIADHAGVTGTAGNIGFVLDAPDENVIGTSPKDTAVQFSTTYMTIPQILRQVECQYPPKVSGFSVTHVPQALGYRHVRLSPQDLLAQTRGYNELLVLDEGLSGARTKISALFAKAAASAKDRAAAEDAAKTLGVPLVELP